MGNIRYGCVRVEFVSDQAIGTTQDHQGKKDPGHVNTLSLLGTFRSHFVFINMAMARLYLYVQRSPTIRIPLNSSMTWTAWPGDITYGQSPPPPR